MTMCCRFGVVDIRCGISFRSNYFINFQSWRICRLTSVLLLLLSEMGWGFSAHVFE